MNTTELRRIVRARHSGGGWLVLDEVQDATGLSSERRIDVFAVALWPSLQYQRVAYELKLSRGDWLRELKQPDKRDTFYRLSHEAWFVLGPDVLLPGERQAAVRLRRGVVPGVTYDPATRQPLSLPFEDEGLWTYEHLAGWGILEAQPDGTLKRVLAAAKREAWPLPNAFASALLARAARISEAAEASA